jgi:uncharacterized protein (TIGR03083 family)
MTPTEPRPGAIITGLVKARGDVWAMGRDVARAHAERPTDEIVHELRRDAALRTMPFVTNAKNILLDVVVHGQDIAVPLGIDRTVPTDTGVASFERAWTMGWPFWAKRRTRGMRLVATDAPVDVGEGEVVEGTLSDLLLLVTQRTQAAAARLTGPGLTRLG